VRLFPLLCLAVALAACDPVLHAGDPPLHDSHLTLWAAPSVPATRVRTVLRELAFLQPRIDRDFRIASSPLRIELLPTHRSFARALWHLQWLRPQSPLDNMSNVVRSRLLIGPEEPAYLHHNLAHIYTEWVLDRLTDNRSDALPRNPWLYDGLAEYEAYRYAPSGMRCSTRVGSLFDVTTIHSPRRWLALRAGPLGSLEYCLAYLRVRTLARRDGWNRMIRLLRRQHNWARLPAALR